MLSLSTQFNFSQSERKQNEINFIEKKVYTLQ
jgi:hypothetical protein